jgi:hypothetical protein
VSQALPFRIPVDRDAAGLQLAARALFEESLQHHKLGQVLDRMAPAEQDRVLDSMPAREISPGYYTRAAYFINLSGMLKLGIPFDPACFTGGDVTGLQAVRSAFAEFEREHPCCPRCGERQDNPHMPKCFGCGLKLRRTGAN